MSKVDLFDHFTAKPVAFTWVIDDFKNVDSCQISSAIKMSSLNNTTKLYLILHFRKGISIYGSFDSSCSFEGNSLPWLYHRISLINDKGQKCNSQEGKYRFDFQIDRDYLFNVENGLLPGGKLTIYSEIFELNTVECTEGRLNCLVSLSRRNQSLLDNGKWSDVVLVVGEREFKAHKNILSAGSVVFEKMFEHDLEESKRNRVNITDMSAGACEDMLKFIYTGKVKALDQYVYELFAAADKYQIDSLKSYCELYLTKSLSVSTVLETLQLANLYSVDNLKWRCSRYISLHSGEFEYNVWKALSTRHPELMFEVFKFNQEK